MVDQVPEEKRVDTFRTAAKAEIDKLAKKQIFTAKTKNILLGQCLKHLEKKSTDLSINLIQEMDQKLQKLGETEDSELIKEIDGILQKFESSLLLSSPEALTTEDENLICQAGYTQVDEFLKKYGYSRFFRHLAAQLVKRLVARKVLPILQNEQALKRALSKGVLLAVHHCPEPTRHQQVQRQKQLSNPTLPSNPHYKRVAAVAKKKFLLPPVKGLRINACTPFLSSLRMLGINIEKNIEKQMEKSITPVKLQACVQRGLEKLKVKRVRTQLIAHALNSCFQLSSLPFSTKPAPAKEDPEKKIDRLITTAIEKRAHSILAESTTLKLLDLLERHFSLYPKRRDDISETSQSIPETPMHLREKIERGLTLFIDLSEDFITDITTLQKRKEPLKRLKKEMKAFISELNDLLREISRKHKEESANVHIQTINRIMGELAPHLSTISSNTQDLIDDPNQKDTQAKLFNVISAILEIDVIVRKEHFTFNAIREHLEVINPPSLRKPQEILISFIQSQTNKLSLPTKATGFLQKTLTTLSLTSILKCYFLQ